MNSAPFRSSATATGASRQPPQSCASAQALLYTQFVASKLRPLSVERRRNPWHGGPPLITKRLSRRVAVTGLPCGAGKTRAKPPLLLLVVNPLLLLLVVALLVVAVLLVVVLPKLPSSHSRSATPSGAAIVPASQAVGQPGGGPH